VLSAAGGGFLLAVLWLDLCFDVQVLRHRAPARLPEPVLASIAGYYRRVTTDAHPMGRLVGAVMLATIAAAALQLVRGTGAPAPRALALVLVVAPAGLALARTLPNAVQLGARADPPERQSALARAICRDHLACLAAIVAFLAIQLARG
jgi:hypothetical protein